MISNFLADIVRFLHICLILFIIVVPFWKGSSWALLCLHAMACMTLIAHWIMNEDTCFLTLVECFFRGVQPDKSFMHSLVSPVYKIEDEELKRWVMRITPLLAITSLSRIYWNWDDVRRDIQLVRYSIPFTW